MLTPLSLSDLYYIITTVFKASPRRRLGVRAVVQRLGAPYRFKNHDYNFTRIKMQLLITPCYSRT
jgi:hypothetical protein